MLIVIAVIAYVLVGVLVVRPSRAASNLANPRVGDIAPIILFWPVYLMACLMDMPIPKRWISSPAATVTNPTTELYAARKE